ncbi:MAG: pyridoxamine 5-phosphate oxidase-related FMN-binding [Acidimicrobiaceae bacterium]|nr:pyridoxamine 5-phosphate oxidase-related FMN-binding [Acidimicrobiaceae bacterium]
MGRTYDVIDDKLGSFIESQSVFFVSTAPLAADGHVNCSPKGNRGELVVLDPSTVAYLDQTGSGVETLAHLRENGRIVLMFCAFEGPPRIVRVHGAGEAVLADDPRFAELAVRFPRGNDVGARSVVVVHARRIADSCGYGVPSMHFDGHRPVMDAWAERKGRAGIREYWASHNAASLDSLPGLDAPF